MTRQKRKGQVSKGRRAAEPPQKEGRRRVGQRKGQGGGCGFWGSAAAASPPTLDSSRTQPAAPEPSLLPLAGLQQNRGVGEQACGSAPPFPPPFGFLHHPSPFQSLPPNPSAARAGQERLLDLFSSNPPVNVGSPSPSSSCSVGILVMSGVSPLCKQPS